MADAPRCQLLAITRETSDCLTLFAFPTVESREPVGADGAPREHGHRHLTHPASSPALAGHGRRPPCPAAAAGLCWPWVTSLRSRL